MDRLEALLRLLPLDALPRTGWTLAGVPNPESVAAHSLGCALVALTLGPGVDPPLDVDRAVALAVIHDAPEALLGDIPLGGAAHLPPGSKAAAEAGAAVELLGPLSSLASERWAEFGARDTREARFVALCDKLQLGIRLVGYRRAGCRGLGEFRGGLERLDCDEFAPCEELRRAILGEIGPS
jgi:putative hydrolases of HD superfamily